MRKILVLLATLLLLSAALFAQQEQEEEQAPLMLSKYDLMLGYSFAHTSISDEGLGSTGMKGPSFQLTRYLNDNWGITADVTRLTKSDVQQSGENAYRWGYLAGPTYAVRSTDSGATPFVHVLAGYDHQRISVPGLKHGQPGDFYSGNFAFDLGAGLDMKANPHMNVRLGQFDYYYAKHGGAFRYTAGLVFKF
ncbi:MAG: outer membrane beta-barrel protein [Acidobacteriota bacterium]|nr:outer membrane beta-barrel protein [Acidobacteriota bacterium]